MLPSLCQRLELDLEKSESNWSERERRLERKEIGSEERLEKGGRKEAGGIKRRKRRRRRRKGVRKFKNIELLSVVASYWPTENFECRVSNIEG